MMTAHTCRHCGSTLGHVVIDLGHQPPSNSYLDVKDLERVELTYPLKVYVCEECWLVQLPCHAKAEELFKPDYAYFSSTSDTWLRHAKKFVRDTIDRMGLDEESYVVELASNDGYLLQYVNERGIPCMGIEPTRATADVARKKGIKTMEEFFGLSLARKLRKADLVIANNVLAHVPDVNDFMLGIAELLKSGGRASIEFPHLLRLLKGNQFDTIYHEHYSYFSLGTAKRIVEKAGLEIVDVDELTTHGGSLRIWLAHSGEIEPNIEVRKLLIKEVEEGLETLGAYRDFQTHAESAKDQFLSFLLRCKESGKKVMGYGAAAKGNTLLNYAGVRSDLIPAIADRAVSKQRKVLPGSHIPVIDPEGIGERRPDYLVVFPWNLLDEIMAQVPAKGYVTAIPSLKVWTRE